MNIREKLMLILQMEAANDKSIERYLKNERDTDALHAVIRREAKIQNELKAVAKAMIDAEKEGRT